MTKKTITLTVKIVVEYDTPTILAKQLELLKKDFGVDGDNFATRAGGASHPAMGRSGWEIRKTTLNCE